MIQLVMNKLTEPELKPVPLGRDIFMLYYIVLFCVYTAVSTKVVQKKLKSVRDNAER